MTPKQALMSVLSETHADAVVDHRRVTIKKPLTAFAAGLLAKRLSEWPGGADEAAEIMIEKCWQGFASSWVRDRQPGVARIGRPGTGHSLLDALGRHH